MANRRSNRILGAFRSNSHQSRNQSINYRCQVSASFHLGGQNATGEGTSAPSLEDRIRKMEESQNEILQLLREPRRPALAPQEEIPLPREPMLAEDIQFEHLHKMLNVWDFKDPHDVFLSDEQRGGQIVQLPPLLDQALLTSFLFDLQPAQGQKLPKYPLKPLKAHLGPLKPNDLQIAWNHLQQFSNIKLTPLNPKPDPGSTWLTKEVSLPFSTKPHRQDLAGDQFSSELSSNHPRNISPDPELLQSWFLKRKEAWTVYKCNQSRNGSNRST
ncbi:hypothetical protein M5K25_009768 [Dendrobium thyrsiflorum]|uniref:Uncharacterized protein n=1 Tax=Dendrobium thyrsiflorum TaxID=117978 RepID=A0ABD0VDD7_DENTH